MVKAAFGGGGRGMRVVNSAAEFQGKLREASHEAGAAFGNNAVFLERFIRAAKHIEIQIIGDRHGNIVHLYERDCSVQRRHQKVVEVAPAIGLPAKVRTELADAAVRLAKAAGYYNAGTVEFLVDAESYAWYFIEVNPRIQVEHTVTEMVTGIDIVRTQIQIAQGHNLFGPEIQLPAQDKIPLHGTALQCRVTTEDPANNFTPDYGKITTYRSPAGFGIRLDGASAYSGAVISPFYDSLLVKVTAWDNNFPQACDRMDRALREFRIRGIKTNIPFLENVVSHPTFISGAMTTSFLDQTPELFEFQVTRDRATKLLTYLADVIVNGNPEVATGPSLPSYARRRCQSLIAEKRPKEHASCSIASDPKSLPSGHANSRSYSARTQPFATPTNPSWPRVCAPTICCASPITSQRNCPTYTASKCGVARPSTWPCVFYWKTHGSVFKPCVSAFPISASKCFCEPPTP